MRANVVLDDQLVEEALRHTTARSKSALIEEALKVFIETRSAQRRRATYERRLIELRRRLGEIVLTKSAVEIVRLDREG